MLYQIQKKLINSLLMAQNAQKDIQFLNKNHHNAYPIELAQQKIQSNHIAKNQNIRLKQDKQNGLKLAKSKSNTKSSSIFYQDKYKMSGIYDLAQRKKIKRKSTEDVIKIMQGSNKWKKQMIKLQQMLTTQRDQNSDVEKEDLYQFVQKQIEIDIFINVELDQLWLYYFLQHYVSINCQKSSSDKYLPFTQVEIKKAFLVKIMFKSEIHDLMTTLSWSKQKPIIKDEEVDQFLKQTAKSRNINRQALTQKNIFEMFMKFLKWRLQR